VPVTPENLNTKVLVVGAGVLGLCAAVELTRRGHEVRVVDPGGANASAVAAGMIAPAMEAVLDAVTPERAALFRAARAAWDGFAQDCGVVIHPAPTVWAGGDVEAVAAGLSGFGFEAVAGEDGRLTLPEDVLIEPGPAMAAMRADLRHPVIAAKAKRIVRAGEGWRVETDAGTLTADVVVLATGAAAAVDGLPVAAAALVGQVTPIRGQIGHLPELAVEAVVRGRGIYVAPSAGGAVVGATMEPGRTDVTPDPEAGDRLRTAGSTLIGAAIEEPVEWRVGIRGSTPDGLPMVGASGEAGLFLALAPRRNGWLLGALAGRVLADAIEGAGQNGDAGSPHAAALDPRRFAIR
jgi:glycine oxidase